MNVKIHFTSNTSEILQQEIKNMLEFFIDDNIENLKHYSALSKKPLSKYISEHLTNNLNCTINCKQIEIFNDIPWNDNCFGFVIETFEQERDEKMLNAFKKDLEFLMSKD